MLKKSAPYIVITCLAIGVILAIEYSKPKKLNWFPSYVTHHKLPYGTYVLTDLMDNLFPDKIKHVNQVPFEFLKEQGDNAKGTYFFVNNKVVFQDSELNVLLDWTEKGNTLFVASESFDHHLLDTLHLDIDYLYKKDISPAFWYQLEHQRLATKNPIVFTRDAYATYFNKIDSTLTKVIGIGDNEAISVNPALKNITMLKQSFGDGEIVLVAFPEAFTNYFILEDQNKDFTAGLLSYIDGAKTIYVDNYYKSGKKFYTSPMYIFLNNETLKWAYYMVVIGTLLYIVFEGKRKQRAIKVVTPLKNQTLEFTRTIANMYFENGQQREIAHHKIASFLDYIRSKFYLNTEKINTDFYRDLSARSNHTPEEMMKLFDYFKTIEERPTIGNEDLKKLNTLIEKFKAQANGK